MRFKQDLVYGQAAEQAFNKRFPTLVPTDGRRGDFLTQSGKLVELKSDRHDPNIFRNVIMERYSRAGVNGGPWQAQEHGSDLFVYDFPKYNKTMVFEVVKLVPELETLIRTNELTLFSIDNGTHTTHFYKIKINYLVDLDLGVGVLT